MRAHPAQFCSRTYELGAVVSIEAVDGAAPPAKRSRFSLTFKDVSELSAAPASPAHPPAQEASDNEGASAGGADDNRASSPAVTLETFPEGDRA